MKNRFTMARQPFDGVDAFLRVAERRNFRVAGEELGMSASAVSQKIKALEDRIGVALLSRTTRSVGLTQAGQVFLKRAGPAMAELAAAYEETSSLNAPAGLLRLHMPKGMIAVLIEPILAEFCAAYPRIDLEILSSDDMTDLVEGGFDAGVQLGELLDKDSVAFRLAGPISFVVVGSPGYFAQHGRPVHPADLRHFDCIRLRVGAEPAGQWTFIEDTRQLHVPVTGRIITDDYSLCIAAAAKGLGLFFAAGGLVQSQIESGALEVVLQGYVPASDGVFLHYPNRAHVLPKLRVFIDFVRTLLRR